MAFDLDVFVKKDSRDGFKVIRNIHHQVRQKLVLLIMMHPGERIMDGKMGVGISRFLFSQGDVQSVASSVASEIQTQVGLYMPYIEIVDISGESTPQDPNGMVLTLSYSVPSLEPFVSQVENDNGEEMYDDFGDPIYEVSEIQFEATNGQVVVRLGEEPIGDTYGAGYYGAEPFVEATIV